MRIVQTAILMLMTLTAFAQQPLAPPQAITDPTKLESKNVADMSDVLHREALHDAPDRRLDLVARRQAGGLHLQHQRAQ